MTEMAWCVHSTCLLWFIYAIFCECQDSILQNPIVAQLAFSLSDRRWFKQVAAVEKSRGLTVEVLRVMLRVSDLAPPFMKLCQINIVA